MRIAQQHDWIAELPANVRRDVRARMSTVSLDTGEAITRTGAPARAIHQIASGYAKILKDLPSGDQVLLALYVPGNVFSESPVLTGRNHHHSTIAATPLTLNVLSKEAFDELFHTHHEIPETLCRKIANAMSLVLQNRELTTLHSVRERVTGLFFNLARTCSVAGADGSQLIQPPLTVSDIADFLGTSRQTVQKEISFLKSEGLLSKQSGLWTVSNVERLRPDDVRS